MNVSVLIPYYPNDCHRQQAYRYIMTWWFDHFPNWECVPCISDPWSKGQALANGAEIAQGEILICADADSYILKPSDLQYYVEQIRSATANWIVPHRFVHRLSHEATEKLYETGKTDITDLVYPVYSGVIGGGMTIMTRWAWDRVGGVDPRFIGWGGEDRSFGWALQTLCGKMQRGQSRLIHLWHPQQGPRQPMSHETMELLSQYRNARGRPPMMRSLLNLRQVV